LRNKKQFFIYPVYFDANRSWSQGRRVKKKLAVQAPSIQEVAQAATILNLDFELNLEAKYPRFWWQPSGRIQVKKQAPFINKNELLKKMAVQIKKVHVKK